MAYRLSLFSFVFFIAISLAWFILSGAGRGGGASFALLYPLLAFLPASAFNLVPLVTGLIQSLGKEHNPTARKAVWISIASGLMPALCIFITFENSPLVALSLVLFVLYGLLAIGFAIALKTKQFDRRVM